MFQSFLSAALRVSGIFGKFLIIFFLAKNLSAEDFGVYGIFTAAAAYGIYLVGLDFYAYAGRAMIQSEKNQWPGMMRDQAVLYVVLYLLMIPVVLIFCNGFLPERLLLLFYVVLVLEHIGQEMGRVLIVFGMQTHSAILMFIRASAWCYLLAFLGFGGYVQVTLDRVFHFWVIADVVGIIFALYCVKNVNIEWKKKYNINYSWIKIGIKTSAYLFVGTIAIRGMFFFDRYFVEKRDGLEMVGVYSLFQGMIGVMASVLDAAVFSFDYPELIRRFKSSNINEFKVAVKKFQIKILILSLVMAAALFFGFNEFLILINKEYYIKYFDLYSLMLLAALIFIAGHGPHYALYAMNMDKKIIQSNIFGVVVFFISIYMTPQFNAIGVVAASVFGFTAVGLCKYIFYNIAVNSINKG